MKKITRITCDLDTRDIKFLIRCLKVFKRYGFTKELTVKLSSSEHGFHAIAWSDKGVPLKKLLKIRRKAGDDSISADTNLYWKENGKLKFTKISVLYTSFKNGNKIEVLTAKIKEKKCNNTNLRLLMTQPYTEIIWGEIQDCWYRGEKEVYLIEVNNGKQIEITKDHSLFGQEKKQGIANKIIPLKLSNLEVVASVDKEIIDYDLDTALDIYLQSKMFTVHDKKPLELYKILCENEAKILTSRELYRCFREKNGEISRDTLNGLMYWFAKIGKIALIDERNKVWRKWRINEAIDEAYKEKIMKELKNLLTFCGLWLADGCYDGPQIHISTGGNKEIINWIKDFCNKRQNIYRKSIKINESRFRKGDVIFSSFYLVGIMKQLGFNGYSDSKKIPSFVYVLPNEYIACLLKGYFSGDGCLTFSHKQSVITACSISKELIYGIKTLLSKLGIESNINHRKQSGGFNGGFNQSPKEIYTLTIEQRNSVKKFLQKIGFIKKYKRNKYIVNGGKKNYDIYLRKIRKIEYIGKKDVYDIEIKPTESFVAEGILCHNSIRCMLDGKSNRMINVLFNHKTKKKTGLVLDGIVMEYEVQGSEENTKICFGEV